MDATGLEKILILCEEHFIRKYGGVKTKSREIPKDPYLIWAESENGNVVLCKD